MTINERVSPKRLAEIIARAEVCDDSVLTDYRDIESIARELQQYRAAAEPVVYIGKQMLESLCDEGGRICGRVWRSNTDELSGESRIPLYASPQVTSVPDDAFERALSVLNDTLDDCGDSERGLLLALDRMGIEVAGAAPAVQAEQLSGNTEQVSQSYTLREGLAAIRNLGPIDAEKIQAERDALNEPDVPDGYALVPVELMESLRSSAHFEKQSYAASFGSHIDTGRWKVEYEELERVCKETDMIMAAAPQPQNVQQNNPENIPQWIPVSERMPESRHAVLVGCWFGSEWSSKWATFVPGHPDAQDSGWLIPGASWTPTHWHELPAAPKQEAE
ncbi:DUF551 domain-containing protein [Atlantibacter hermannii]|uniref:DUF551 domain-containing protein n=1 Tax=Atlantibacter hermannii TaxID=565 RepID=UPI0028AC8BD5|nr:DUF551 domain-containing protein [Atlantibacter hermannii]